MAFVLMVFFSLIPLTAVFILFRMPHQRFTYPLGVFYLAISMWQMSIAVLYGEGWLEQPVIEQLFRFFRAGTVMFAPLLFYMIYQLLFFEALKLSDQKKRRLKKIINKPAFITLLMWSMGVYAINWTSYGIAEFELHSIAPFNEVFYYPMAGALGWTFSLNVLLIFAINMLAIYLTFSIVDKHRKTFLMTFFTALLCAYVFGIVNLSPESPLFQAIFALIILVMGIFYAYIKMNYDMIKEGNGQLFVQQLFLRKVIDSNPNYIYAKDQNGRFSMVNTALAAAYQTTPEEMTGKSEKDYSWTQAQAPQLIQEDLSLLEKNEQLVQEKQPFATADGERTVQMTKKPIFFAEGHKELLCVANDITELEQKEEYIRRTEKMNIVGQLAAGVAHEIRNPLTSLKGFVQLIDQEYQIDPKYTTIMLDELDRIHFVASELLVLAKPEIAVKDTIALTDLVKDVIGLLTMQAMMKSISIEHVSFNEEIKLEGNANQLKQVFINILKNAVEASGENATILVQENVTDGKVAVSISDQGVGMSEERISRLGEPFYTNKTRGTGLGLMISFRIIKEHGGEVSFKSKEGTGTTVTICLPVHEVSR